MSSNVTPYPPRPAKARCARKTLNEVVDQQEPSAETGGLIGRIHKARWTETRTSNAIASRGHLANAISACRSWFTSDSRDAFPGTQGIDTAPLTR
ncbi:MAG: tetratricopeptide repeat-containing protein [Gemmatimonadaceae bacterium]